MSAYEQHDRHFASVAAYVVTKDGKLVANVAFKLPADGAARLYCYVHILGTEMVRGSATGGGYDKHSAAFISASARLQIKGTKPTENENMAVFKAYPDDGAHWDGYLMSMGYLVLRAV